MFSTAKILSGSASSSPVDEKAITVDKNDEAYRELIQSIPSESRSSTEAELDSIEISKQASSLCENLTFYHANKVIAPNLSESRNIFLAALRNVRDKEMSVSQLASLHILDSAIRTLYTDPMIYMIHNYIGADNIEKKVFNIFPISDMRGMPTSILSHKYNTLVLPNADISVSQLPDRMQNPLIKRFFNFNDIEWTSFCKKMDDMQLSEKFFSILIAPQEGCWSSIIFRIQRVLKCMRVLDWLHATEAGYHAENIMLVPSFSMFQAAIDVKAHTLGRKPVELVPTYGYIEAEHYANLKSSGKIAMAMYLPEKNTFQRYQLYSGGFRTTIDGHPVETAFAGALHDIYHAMREMMMSENVAKARIRLATIAKNHPNNKLTSDDRAVDDILVDGELIYSYPPTVDTIFDPGYRPSQAQSFGELFYVSSLRPYLHEDLKRAFIEDMVVNEELWKREYNIDKCDLRIQDHYIFNEIKSQKEKLSAKQSDNIVPFSDARSIMKVGLLATTSPVSDEAQTNSPSLSPSNSNA